MGAIRETMLSMSDPNQIRQQVTQFAADAADAIMSGKESVPLTLDTSAWRNDIAGYNETEMLYFLRTYPEMLAPCGDDQQAFADGSVLPVCIPPTMTGEDMAYMLMENEAIIRENLPDSLTYEINLDMSEETLISLHDLRNGFSSILLTLVVIAMVSWFAAAFIYAKRRSVRFRWLGATLIIPGLLLTLASLAFSQTLLAAILQANVATMNSLDTVAGDMMTGGVLRVSGSFLLAGMIPTIIGILLFVYGSRHYRRDARLRSEKKKNDLAATMPERRKKPIKRQP